MAMAPQTETALAVGTISQTLAEFAHGMTYDDIPVDVRERAKYLILDAVGIAMASTRYPFAKAILAGIQAVGEPGVLPVIGLTDRLGMRDAVLMLSLIHI